MSMSGIEMRTAQLEGRALPKEPPVAPRRSALSQRESQLKLDELHRRHAALAKEPDEVRRVVAEAEIRSEYARMQLRGEIDQTGKVL